MANVNKTTVPTIVFYCVSALAAQPLSQNGTRPENLSGWGNARWGMTESEVKRTVKGRWRTATKEEREDDRDAYVPFVLQDIGLGGRKFTGLFGFSHSERRLVGISLHSGIPFMEAA